MEEKSSPKRPYYRQSTASQRRILFEEWEQIGKVKKACEKTRLSRGTFYFWKPRFEKEGYAGLENPHSHAPLKPRKTESEIEEQVAAMKTAHPEWGYRRIADELMKENEWKRVISYGPVRRILKEKGLISSKTSNKKEKKRTSSTSCRKARADSER